MELHPKPCFLLCPSGQVRGTGGTFAGFLKGRGRAGRWSQASLSTLGIRARSGSHGPQLGAGTYKQIYSKQLNLVKLPKFTHTWWYFILQMGMIFKSHNFREFVNFIDSLSFLGLSQERRVNERLSFKEKEEEKINEEPLSI